MPIDDFRPERTLTAVDRGASAIMNAPIAIALKLRPIEARVLAELVILATSQPEESS